ncbi:MAG: hypothetical protein R3Y59_09865 [bacterium]
MLALGDEDLHNAIETNNIATFISLCCEKGLISKIQKDELVKYKTEIITPDGPQMLGVVAAGVAAFGVAVVIIVAGVGCAGAATAGTLAYEQYHYTETQTWVMRHLRP